MTLVALKAADGGRTVNNTIQYDTPHPKSALCKITRKITFVWMSVNTKQHVCPSHRTRTVHSYFAVDEKLQPGYVWHRMRCYSRLNTGTPLFPCVALQSMSVYVPLHFCLIPSLSDLLSVHVYTADQGWCNGETPWVCGRCYSRFSC